MPHVFHARTKASNNNNNSRSHMKCLEFRYDLRSIWILGIWLFMHASIRRSKLFTCILCAILLHTIELFFPVTLKATFISSFMRRDGKKIRQSAQEEFSWAATWIGYTCKRIDAVETKRKEGKKKSDRESYDLRKRDHEANTFQNGMKWYSRMTLTILSIEREHERELNKRLILIELHGIYMCMPVHWRAAPQGLRCASHFHINNCLLLLSYLVPANE